MFTNYSYEPKSYPKGAFEIDLEARKREKDLALMNAELKAEYANHTRRSVNPLVRLITSLFGI